MLNNSEGKGQNGFLNKRNTDGLKALAIIIIIISHMARYMPISDLFKSLIGGGGSLGVGIFFFLSGYGNACSLKRASVVERRKKCIYRVVKTIGVFAICLTLLCVFLSLFGYRSYSISEYFKHMFVLQIPETTTWYLKVQLSYYIVLLALCILGLGDSPHIQLVIVTIFSALEGFFFYAIKSSWWNGNTALCFSLGMCVFTYYDTFRKYFIKFSALYFRIIAMMVFILLYIPTCFGKVAWLQPIIFILLVLIVLFLWSGLGLQCVFFLYVPRITLALYLIHIGLLKPIFENGWSIVTIFGFLGASGMLSLVALGIETGVKKLFRQKGSK